MGASAKDARAGGAFYELWGKDGLSGVFAKVKKNAQAFLSFMSRAASAAGVAGGALTAPLAALFKGGMDRAGDLARLNLQLGVPIEQLHKMQYAADAAGVSIDEVMNDWTGRYTPLINRAPAIDPNDAKAAAQAQLDLSDAVRSVQNALLPLVQIVAKYVSRLAEFVKNNAGAAKTILAVGVGLVAVAAAAKLLTLAFSVLGPVASLAWAAVTGPVGLGVLLGALLGGGLFAALAYLNDGFKTLKKTGLDLGDTLGKAFGGIKDALASANIELAWRILVQSLKVLWLEFADSATMVWIGFKMTFVDTWVKAIAGLKIAWIEFTGWIQKQLNAVIDGFLSTAATAARRLPRGEALAAKIDAARGRGLSDDAVDRLTRLKADRVAEEAAGDLARRKADRGADFLAGKKELADAKAELDRLRKEAAVGGGLGGLGAALSEKVPQLKQGLLGGVTAKGSFSGAALSQQLGQSDQVQKQTELMRALVDGKGQLPKEIATQLKTAIEATFKIR